MVTYTQTGATLSAGDDPVAIRVSFTNFTNRDLGLRRFDFYPYMFGNCQFIGVKQAQGFLNNNSAVYLYAKDEFRVALKSFLADCGYKVLVLNIYEGLLEACKDFFGAGAILDSGNVFTNTSGSKMRFVLINIKAFVNE